MVQRFELDRRRVRSRYLHCGWSDLERSYLDWFDLDWFDLVRLDLVRLDLVGLDLGGFHLERRGLAGQEVVMT